MTQPAADELVREHLEHIRAAGRSPSAVSYAQQALAYFRRFLAARGPGDPADAWLGVTVDDLAAFSVFLTEPRRATGRPLAESTQEGYFRRVRDFYRRLARTGRILADPTAALGPRRRVDGLPRAVPTQEEMRRILGAPDVRTPHGLRDRAILELFYSTGLRRSELMRLSIHDVDLARGVIRVRRGKGKKDRVVPLGKVAARWIAEYARRIRPAFVQDGAEVHLFLSQRGRGLSFVTLGKLVDRYVRKAELARRVTCHSLRHAFATHLHQEGAGIRPIQAMLGHESLDSTQIYTRLVPDEVAKAIERFHPLERAAAMGEVLGELPPTEATPESGPSTSPEGRRRRRGRRR